MFAKFIPKPCNNLDNFKKRLAASKLSSRGISKLMKYFRKRINHVPVQYILKRWHYAEIMLHTKPPIFIPRIESSQICDIAASRFCGFNRKGKPFRFLEIGVGTGAISILLLSRHDNLLGEGCDINPKAIQLAKKNLLQILGESWPNFYTLHSCGFEEVPLSQIKFDFIISNPPYISEEEYHTLPQQVRRFESKIALVSADNGFWHVSAILQFAEEALINEGKIILELDPLQLTNLSQHLGSQHIWKLEEEIYDVFGIRRFAVLTKLSL